jgi:flavin-dependent dehydrogenase
MLPGCFRNHGNYVVSLANVCRWLGQQAEAVGVEIFPGFAAAEVLFREAARGLSADGAAERPALRARLLAVLPGLPAPVAAGWPG